MIFDITAPQWALRAAKRIEAKFLAVSNPQHPARLYAVDTAADLPSASQYIDCAVINRATGTILISDGTNWS